jgi:protein SCO1/2
MSIGIGGRSMQEAPPLRWLLAVLCAASAFACKSPPPPLDDIGTLPAWHMTDQNGAAIGSETLRGRPWVANFLFTSCPTSCPPLARATAKLQERMRVWQPKTGAPLARIVSISVDPETDTPERLTEWGKEYHVDPRLWLQATGTYEAMETLVVGGFMQPIIRKDRQPGQPPPEAPTPMDTAHSLRFVLVDANGHLRGLYEQDEAALAKLDADLQQLAEVNHE